MLRLEERPANRSQWNIGMIHLTPDPERPVIKADLLSDMMELYLEEVDVTPRTHEAYVHQLRPFQVWWEEYGPQNGFIIDESTLQIFFRWITTTFKTHRGRPMRPSSIKSTLIKVRQLFRWLHHTGRLPLDISSWLPDIKVHTPPQRFLSIEQCQLLFDSVPAGPLRFRDLALVAFLLGTGARRFEASAAKWEHTCIDEQTYMGHTKLWKVKNDMEGKGRGRMVVFGPGTGRLLHYHRLFLRLTGQYDPNGEIFGMSNNAVRLRFDVFSKNAGFKVSSHDCRRTFSDYWWTHIGEDERAVTALKLQLGHTLKNDVTFNHYINTSNEAAILKLLKSVYISPVEECSVEISL